MTESTAAVVAAKADRLAWIARLYSYDEHAISDAVADEMLFDRRNDFGMQHFLDSYRPLTKLREKHGPLTFAVGEVTHDEPDVTLAELHADLPDGGRVTFVQRVRFEEAWPCRVRYWSSYPPLPADVRIRPYTPADAGGCVALERLCPMESADGTRWILDRGTRFDDYLQLMAPTDAWVAEHNGEIVGFFSCALRPVRYQGESCYAVYQHHYRVHPEHRAGSISVALASHVDPRRTFDGMNVPFPYSLVDPDNVHMQHVGFPAVPEVRIARLTLSLARLREGGSNASAPEQPSVETILTLLAATHGDRVLYPGVDADALAARWSRVADFDHSSYRGTSDAFVGLWLPGERNVLERGDTQEIRRLGFVLDYGALDPARLLSVLQRAAADIDPSLTHLALMCDTRAPEYEQLKPFADDVAELAIHTLPWIIDELQKVTVYCDGAYC